MWSFSCVFIMLAVLLSFNISDGFVPPMQIGSVSRASIVLSAKKKKRKRKRKEPPSAPAAGVPEPSTKAPATTIPESRASTIPRSPTPTIPDLTDSKPADEELTQDDIDQMKDVASFEFKPDDSIAIGFDDKVKDADGNEFKLPDIKDALRKKELDQEMARIAEEEMASKPKIKRGDAKAMKKLLESTPFADADDSFFEEQEYNVVSALLGERAETFLGIPTGPIQVGHFIGSLGIFLMAFVEYPGFPLTNLPTPIRTCFQGGLATVYLVNTVLAVLSVFKASERGQPVPLWIAKTFAVGGLAYDQLTQLPTLDETKKAESTKGKRAPNKRR